MQDQDKQNRHDAMGLLGAFMNELTNHAQHVKALENENLSLRADVQKKNQEIVELHARLRSQDTENRELDACIAKFETRITELDAETQRVNVLLSSVKSRNEKYVKTIHKLNQQVAISNAQIAEMFIHKKEAEHFKAENQMLLEQIEKLGEEIKNLKLGEQGLIDAFWNERLRAQEAENKHGRPVDGTKAYEKRQTLISQMHDEAKKFALNRLQGEISSTGRMLDHYQSKCEDLEAQKKSLLSIVSSTTGIIKQMATDSSAGETIAQMMNEQVSYVESMMCNYVQNQSLSITDLNQTLETTREELSNAKNVYSDLHRDYQCAQTTVKALRTEMKRMKEQEALEFKKQVATLHELDALQKSFAQLTAERDQCRIELSQAILMRDQLDSTLKEVHRKNLDYREKIQNTLTALMGQK